MTTVDWFIVIALNALVFGFGALRSFFTRSDVDWFLGGRTLPFWLVGMSMFATSVDGGEYVSINGATYRDGLTMFAGLTFGIGLGGVIAAFVVVPPIYRGEYFTNAEYLEARFGLPARVISVLVQIQYRTAVLAMITVALHLMLTNVAKLGDGPAWVIIAIIATATTLYAAWGGLKTVAATDVLLGSIMLAATLALWGVISHEVGGWEGASRILASREGADTAATLLHVGSRSPGAASPIVEVLGWFVIATGYFVVNHTQTMKMMGARSLWHVQMSVIVGVSLIMLSGCFSSTLGVFGRALMPGLDRPDMIYPVLVDRFLGVGVKGLVMAGVLASAVSTFEGIGAALSALFTRDIYARLIVKNAGDRHYLNVSRAATVVIVAISFTYIPFVLYSRSLVDFFVRITSVFVTPLLTVYLLGVLTRVDRRSAVVGLIVGPLYGIAAISLGDTSSGVGLLPAWFTEKFVSYLWSMFITSSAMIIATFVMKGRPSRARRPVSESSWLVRSQHHIDDIGLRQRIADRAHTAWWCRPELWAAVMLIVAAYGFLVRMW